MNPARSERSPSSAAPPPPDLLHLLVDSVDEAALFVLDPAGLVASWNPGAKRIYGHTAAEILARPYSALGADAAGDGSATHLERARAEGRAARQRLLVRGDGARMWTSETCTSLNDPSGRHVGFAVVARDVTDARLAEAGLRESEERLRMALDAAHMGTFDWDIRTGAIAWSPRHEELWGFAAGEFDGTCEAIARRLHPDDRDAITTEVTLRMAERARWSREFRVIWPDGSVHWLAGLGQFQCEDDGAPIRMRGVVVDRTARRLAEEQLRERAVLAALSADVAAVLSRSPDVRSMLHACADAVVRHLGAAFARIWTLNRAADVLELQASAGQYTHLDGPHGRIPMVQLRVGRIAQERSPCLVNDLLSDPGIIDLEWARRERMAAFAGCPLVVEDRLVGVVALFALHPLPESVLAALTSVSDAIAVGIERIRSESLLHSVLNNVNDAIVDVDDQGIIQSFNAAAERLFGYAEAEVLGRNVSILMPEPYRSEHDTCLESYLRTGDAKIIGVGRQLGHRRKDGTTFPGHLTVCESSVDGRRHFTGVVRDLTRQLQLEAQLQQAQKMEALGRLAGGVAHDFNNLLTVILGFGETLREEVPLSDPKRRAVDAIHEAGERASALTRQLLAFSRRTVLQPTLVNLNAIVQETERLLARVIPENIRLVSVLAQDLRTVRADPGQVGQVLVNLVMNARDAMPQGGTVTVETRNADLDEHYCAVHPYASPGRYAVLCVTDTGIGIPREQQARIFEPFYTTKEEGTGTGLGLATVYGIVRQSGGPVEVYSEPGCGASFKVYFPEAGIPGAPARAEGAALRGAPGGSETVLLVEDDPSVRALARMGLEAFGYRVLEAENADQALRIADGHAEPIHLLLTDVVLPGMEGRELAERLCIRRPGLQVLYMSGYTDDAVVRQGLLQEEVAFLQKPYTPATLAARVREVLDARPR